MVNNLGSFYINKFKIESAKETNMDFNENLAIFLVDSLIFKSVPSLYNS